MSNNGISIIVPSGNAKGRANYPHARLASLNSNVLYISGTGSRREDGTFDGVRHDVNGNLILDIEQQTDAVLRNIEAVIKHATNNKASLQNVIDATVFLTDIRAHYSGMNAVWNRVWPSYEQAPSRTTIGIKELPSPEMIVEIKCTAVVTIAD
ncbi:unnamed protein product [Clonostachys rosea]|uniref:Uncharacterized protein n=1 Tax=Bionectria ochroleuca TaxID=29856 RepID=A0ABY6UMD5_BIOOC|nr:unnamed protein product [Clonostachys rosea]